MCHSPHVATCRHVILTRTFDDGGESGGGEGGGVMLTNKIQQDNGVGRWIPTMDSTMDHLENWVEMRKLKKGGGTV